MPDSNGRADTHSLCGEPAKSNRPMTRTFALLVDAHISRAAVAVFRALGQGNCEHGTRGGKLVSTNRGSISRGLQTERRPLRLTQAAAISGVASVAGEALAGGLVVVCAALGVDAAHAAQAARVLADAVDADLVEEAVVVTAAAHCGGGSEVALRVNAQSRQGH